jgi:type I restriction enzyme S subunit
MTYDLKPYPAYKDSGVPWLDQVPEHWDVLPTRALFAEVKEREHPDEQMLSVAITQGVIPQKTLLEGSSKKDSSNQDRSAYKLVCPGDIAYNKMRAWQGAIGVSEFRGIVSPAYVVARLRQDNNARYFHHLFRTPQFAKEAERWSYGITSDMWSLRPEHFKMIYCSLPSRDEQAAIVRFLDHADRSIRRYIRAKQKLIKLLEEQKQAIIHRAVTRGLNSNVRLKPSGVEWLGDVPENWQVASLARFSIKRCDGPFGTGLKSSHYTSEGVRVVRLQNIGVGEFRDRDAAYISHDHYATLGDHGVIQDDLIVAGLGDGRIPAGRACVAPPGIEPAMVKADCFRFRLDPSHVSPRFAAYQLSATAPMAAGVLSTGATRQRINLQSTSARAIALPPQDEQDAILRHLAIVSIPLESAIAVATREIDLIREYRTRLIADVVTGKLDVREVAANLPDEVEEETLEGKDERLEEEEVSEDNELEEFIEEEV